MGTDERIANELLATARRARWLRRQGYRAAASREVQWGSAIADAIKEAV